MPFTIDTLDIIDAIESPKLRRALIDAERRASTRRDERRRSAMELTVVTIVGISVGTGIEFAEMAGVIPTPDQSHAAAIRTLSIAATLIFLIISLLRACRADQRYRKARSSILDREQRELDEEMFGLERNPPTDTYL